jgi:Rieske Fe-S protein
MKKDNRHKMDPAKTSRRGFLKRIWVGLGVLAGIEFGFVTIGFLSGGKKNKGISKQRDLLNIGRIGDFENNSVFPFRSGKFYLVRTKNGGFLALSLNCTHLGCSVMWDKEKQEFLCPCHASSFDIMGNVIHPPAPRALDYYPVILKEGEVWVDISKSVKRNSFNNSQLVYA